MIENGADCIARQAVVQDEPRRVGPFPRLVGIVREFPSNSAPTASIRRGWEVGGLSENGANSSNAITTNTARIKH